MAGAFTHFVICDVAKRRRKSLQINLYRLLNKYYRFLFLGAASPDLPYLSFKTGEVNWADVMHYQKTNSMAVKGHEGLKESWSVRTQADEIKFIWLLGYVSHLVADASIHPIVESIVGPYEENQEEHRICEMTQDSLIFKAYENHDIYYAEFSSTLKYCKDSEHFDELIEFWKSLVSHNYHEKGEEPNPSLWFTTYTKAIDSAEGGSGFVGLFRHLGTLREYVYRTKDEILSNHEDYFKNYYSKINLPSGLNGSFKKDAFERTVDYVLDTWNFLYQGLEDEIVVSSLIKNWNLDKGVDLDSPNGEVTYWHA